MRISASTELSVELVNPKNTFWVQILRGFLENFESMSMDLKNAENCSKKYLKPRKIHREQYTAKIDYFLLAVSQNVNHLLKSSDV